MSKTLPALTMALIATMLCATAYAGTGKTRAEVRAETLAAIRNGDIIEGNGLPARYMNPSLYPVAPAVVGKTTRAEVKAELAQAIHTGNMPAPGRITMTQREESPEMYG